MQILGLWLQQFRNFTEQQWIFSPGMNVFSAPNGSGKSNLIEALSLLSTGDSWRAQQTDELILWGAELARVQAKFEIKPGEEQKLEQIYTHGVVQGKRTNKRLYRVNGVSRRAGDAVGQLLTILFTPEDMEVFHGGSVGRRKLLDSLLDQLYPEYRYARRQYEQALKRRNKLLQQSRDGGVAPSDFFFWNRLLVQHGEVLHAKRSEFLYWLGQQSGIRETYQVVYDHSVMSEARLEQYASAERAVGYTLVGPHKDDVEVQVLRGGEWRDIRKYGSRGEQRVALVWWKLSQVAFMEQVRGTPPVLLLDDVFSELDAENQERVSEAAHRAQAIVTTVEPGYPQLIEEN